MNMLPSIIKRQLARYLCAPATYLSIAVFLALSTTLGLHNSQLLEQNSTDLQDFFQLHPWLYLLLIPALSTQLWADEHETGLSDLLITLPVTNAELIIGKFFAAWVITAMTLALTLPIVVMVNLLGSADNAVIATQYLASWLLAGSYLSIGCLICALSRHHLIIFILTLSILLVISGLSSVLDALEHQAPIWVIDSVASLSPLSRFTQIDHGVIVLRDCLYFISVIVASLAATTVILNYKNS
ncbi:ABC transporter permease [Pseudomonas sp. Marseille-Q1929]|uniref:ABC transporter permease n=1 Tax=Pseudomonas sp. Marseille-Q1929 TaxID=2730402 RepID=UPI001A9075D4|nr:ABC transporter permease [Pseudomonas sp. Marseille-Q1929]MBO0493344.1 ABC transporter permease [Pseudomonas sp. Marseille-Q1929]